MTGRKEVGWYASEDPNYLMHGVTGKGEGHSDIYQVLTLSHLPSGHLIVIMSFNPPVNSVVGIFVPIL